MDYNRRQQPQHQVALPSVADVGSLVVRGVTTFAKNHKVISGSYILGVLFLLLIGSGTKLTYDQQRQYNRLMNQVDVQAEHDASIYYAQTVHAYRATKGWFSCDMYCQRNKKAMDKAKYNLDMIRKEGYEIMSEAKSVAGLFSEVGVEEVSDTFWEKFHSGKAYAKRQSMWDAMFMGIRSMSRDESMLEYVFRVLMQVLLNFTIGLVMAAAMFVFSLWAIIKSYQPNPLTAVAFFIGASCAAFAFVSTYIMGIYGAAAGGVFGMLKLAENTARLEQGGGGNGRRPGINRPHYD